MHPRQSDFVQNRLTPGDRVLAIDAGEPSQTSQPIQRAQFFRHGLALRAIADALDQAWIVPGCLAKNRQAPRTGLELTGDDLDQRAFAGSVWADQSGQPSLDLEADIIQP